MRRGDKLNLRERLQQVTDNLALPVGVEVKIELIDQDDSGCLGNNPVLQVRVQCRHPVGDVRGHSHDTSVAIAQKVERQPLRVTADRDFDAQFISFEVPEFAGRPRDHRDDAGADSFQHVSFLSLLKYRTLVVLEPVEDAFLNRAGSMHSL